MSDDPDDPFLVTSPLGITSVLRTLVTQKTLVHMRLEHHSQAIITTLLDVDRKQGHVIVDAAADADFNRHLATATKVHFDAVVDKIRVQFHTGQAQRHTFDERAAFRLPYPTAVRRIQRRDNFRIDIPVGMPLLCEIPYNGGEVLKLPVKDISAGGVALLDRNEAIDLDQGAQLRQCTLELDDVGTVVLNLNIRRVSEQLLGNDKPMRVIACEFNRPTPSDSIMIQNYIGRLERLLNARRRGFE